MATCAFIRHYADETMKNLLLRPIYMLSLMIISIGGMAQDDRPESRTLLVIDTDLGLDDIRAITLLFRQPEFRILGLITSDGATDPVVGAKNLAYLLNEWRNNDGNGREPDDLLLGIGLTTDKPAPPFRTRASEVFTGSGLTGAESNEEGQGKTMTNDPEPTFTDTDTFYETLLNQTDNRSIVYLCLGPLTNLAHGLDRYPGLMGRINRIIYAGNSPANPELEWNTARDSLAARQVFGRAKRITAYSPVTRENDFFNQEMIRAILLSRTPTASLFREIFFHEAVDPSDPPHLFLYDDLFSIYLGFPEFFMVEETDFGLMISGFNQDMVKLVYRRFLTEE